MSDHPDQGNSSDKLDDILKPLRRYPPSVAFDVEFGKAKAQLQRLISQEAVRMADERLINKLQALIDRSYHPKREVHDITAIGMGVFDLLAAITAEIAALEEGK